jgi:hypothetical protein
VSPTKKEGTLPQLDTTAPQVLHQKKLSTSSIKGSLRGALGAASTSEMFGDLHSESAAASSMGFASGGLARPISAKASKNASPNLLERVPTPVSSPTPILKKSPVEIEEENKRTLVHNLDADIPTVDFKVISSMKHENGLEGHSPLTPNDHDDLSFVSPGATKLVDKTTFMLERKVGYKVSVTSAVLNDPMSSKEPACHSSGQAASSSTDTKPYYNYVIEVTQGDNKFKLFRRYNVFYWLNVNLKGNYTSTMRDLAFPKKTYWGGLNKSFIENRRLQLDKWLKNLVSNPRICDSDELRSFLAPDENDEIISLSGGKESSNSQDSLLGALPTSPRNPSRRSSVSLRNRSGTALYVMDPKAQSNIVSRRLSMKGMENPYSRERNQSIFVSAAASVGVIKSDLVGTDLLTNIDAEEMERVEHQVYLLVKEIFELDDGSWLRRNLLSVTRSIIRFGFEGTLQKVMQETYLKLSSAEIVATTITWITETIWPKGVFFTPAPLRTLQEQDNTRREVQSAISKSIPGAIVSLVGARNTKHANIKIFEFLQSPTLVRNLFYTIIDMLLLKIFPDIKVYTTEIASVPQAEKDKEKS